MTTTGGTDDPWGSTADPIAGAGADRGDASDAGRADHHADDTDHHDHSGDHSGDHAGGPADGHRHDSSARLAEEARKLAGVVVGHLGDVRGEVREKVVEPLMRKHPEVAAHLGAAGYELKSAYRAFLADRERRWASRAAPAQRVALDRDDEPGTRD